MKKTKRKAWTRRQPTACLCVMLGHASKRGAETMQAPSTSRNKTWTIFIKALIFFFENKLREFQSRRAVSYRVGGLIAQTRKELIFPAAKEMVGVMVGEKAAKELNMISDNTVKRRIDNMAEDVLKHDECTDIETLANVMAFVRYVYDGEVHEGLSVLQTVTFTHYHGNK